MKGIDIVKSRMRSNDTKWKGKVKTKPGPWKNNTSNTHSWDWGSTEEEGWNHILCYRLKFRNSEYLLKDGVVNIYVNKFTKLNAIWES
jgi:hypothetical protein